MKETEPPKEVKVTYKGEPCLLGRFGSVVTGQELTLTEKEWQYISDKGDSDFALSGEKQVAPKKEPVDEPPTEDVVAEKETTNTSEKSGPAKTRTRSRK